MPELPEVQTTVNGINKYAKGLVIKDVWTDYKSDFHAGKDNIKNPDYFKKFRNNIIGAKIKNSSHIGKNVLINLSSGKTIVTHMKMTGHFLYGAYEYNTKKNMWTATNAGPLRDDPFNKWIHFVMIFSNKKSLTLSDMRKFARVNLEDTKMLHDSPHLEGHGPDALDPKFTLEKFGKAVATKPHWPIKKTLMDYTVISGIGNIYSDEILWRAGIHPLEKVKNIPAAKIRQMYKAMKATLVRGIDFGGDSMSDYRNVMGKRGKFQEKHEAYRRTGEKCRKPGCRGIIRRIKVGGRSAHFCSVHQKLSCLS
ncbi:MAG TPA: bifunctional DNA-formamidopyrimidine glycosylase/DNA-(apurinic or apyrimidinic site) lyase [Candidatus Paceibacterota bacterium]|nr:bifunctional DNA-formamidopyrimidine glycosylase/DNA-(apurinic or apyrimidinic site) lyase [Candidatus Paceibacterota bacterium]